MTFDILNRFTLAVFLLAGLPAIGQMQPTRTIILIGPPGSGKTVQAEALRKIYKIPAISMSQLLQREINHKSPIGKELAASMNSGELLSDGPANELMKARLLRSDAGRGFILDGYPATEGQATALDLFLSEHQLPKPIIVVLNVSEDVSRNRMVRRNAAGDDVANIERRLRDYKEMGKLVEQHYGQDRLVRIAGSGTPAEVTTRISNGIDDVNANQGLKTRSPEGGGLKRRPPAESKP